MPVKAGINICPLSDIPLQQHLLLQNTHRYALLEANAVARPFALFRIHSCRLALASLVYLARAHPLRPEFAVLASAWPTSPPVPVTIDRPQARPAPAPAPGPDLVLVEYLY
eukprot:6191533-Pleurochrysis_carterae.AAC.4